MRANRKDERTAADVAKSSGVQSEIKKKAMRGASE